MQRSIAVLLAGVLPALLAAQPANDEPCTALPLALNVTCTFTTVDNVGATLTSNVPGPGCGSLTNGDVWYTISAPAAGPLRIETASGTMTDAAMALYAAPSCDGPFTLLACDDDSGMDSMPFFDLMDLEPGATLYLRTWGYNGTSGDFSVCASGILEIPEGDCLYHLELFDSFGDGWGTGARIGYSVNGGPLIVDSLAAGGYASKLIGVDLGDVLTLSYMAGAQNNENSVVLGLWGSAGAYFLGSDMATNAGLYTGLVDCQPPTPLAGDCGYAAWLCSDTLFPKGALMNGYSVDLDPSNQGCLAAGERQGIWTQFTVATDGTLAFTLSSPFQSDIDFAIWGPLDSIVCPPVGAPIRCSYASQAAPTGLSTSATDVSESAGGDGWVRSLDVLAGQRYLLYIDNFSTNSSPLELTWQLSEGATLLCPSAPEAHLQVSNALILPGGSVNFIDQSTNNPTAWSWSFPGGIPDSSSDQDPIGVVYELPGCYDVSLTSYNAGGQGSTTQDCAVMVDATTGLGEVTDGITLVQQASGISLRNARGSLMQALLLDTTGRVLLSTNASGEVHLPTGDLSTGQYLVVVTDDHDRWSRRVVIVQ
ncbi:MAG: hypothetical protein KDC00_11905 [Flavobacteriales bacterium]|nr:hypothetical protein [Flavobacteriales bacterium]